MTEKARFRKLMTCEERAATIKRLRERAWRDPSLSKEQKRQARYHADRLEKLNQARIRAGKE